MKTELHLATACSLLVVCAGAMAQRATAHGTDAHLREVHYDPHAVVAVPVKRGVVTLVVLDADEAISEVGAGLGGDCAKLESAWCIAAQPGGRTLFIKPKRIAASPNNLAVVTNRRIHNFRLVVLADEDPRPSLHRLVVKAPPLAAPALAPLARAQAMQSAPALNASLAPLPPRPSAEQLVSERLQAKPVVLNTQYALAEGAYSQDIVPTLVFDDGRFTYLRFLGNREIPAVFHVLPDGSETLVNARIEDDLLVVDRVSRRLVLRAGAAVVGLWNEAFDLDGVPPEEATTVPGLRRTLRATEQPGRPAQAVLRSDRPGGAP
ncbi:TrbG/VirB9 family P-type conjugative transfer protein [Paucibacter sp. JuS9]|uniref:TrbG/VirB9 family P-type conjugative transfer protein n=1 Tax=Roseateles TaxID=93681 RepID=UPI002FE65478